MKRYVTFFLIMMALGAVSHLAAQTTIENKAGKLSELLVDPNVIDLTIHGEMNANDFAFLRKQKKINRLKLSQVKIVAGGSYEVNGETVSTKSGMLPAYFLFNSLLAQTLETLVLPAEVKVIEKRALQTAKKLTSLILPEGLEEFGELALCGLSALEEIELPTSVKKIGPYAFWNCKALSSISLPSTLETLAEGAFQECTALSEIDFPKTILDIPNHLFKGCSALESVECSDFLLTIGKSAFEGCSSLSNPPTLMLLQELGEKAFKGCTALEEINLSTCPLKTIADNTFDGCTALTAIHLPSSIEIIGPYAFYECSGLEKIALPAGVKTIYGGAFAATAITRVIFPEGASEITYGAFARCKNLTTIHLPLSITKLSDKAFGGCTELARVIIDAPKPPKGDLEGLADITAMEGVTLVVPNGSKKKYAAAEGWKAFGKIVEDKVYSYKLTAEKDLPTIINEKIDAGELMLEEIHNLKLTGLLSYESLEFIGTIPTLRKLDLSGIKINEDNNDILEWHFGESDFHAQEINFPKEYVEIPPQAFARCFNLRTITFAETITSIGEEAFAYCGWLESTPFLESVTSLGDWAFAGCGALKEVTLPKGANKIPDYFFFACSNLSKVILSEELSDIGIAAFANCLMLSELTLPATVEKIQKYTFLNCNKLKKLKLHSEEPPTVEYSAFAPEHYKTISIAVKKSEGDAILFKYKAAEVWKEFENYSTFNNTQLLKSEDNILCYGGKGFIALDNKGDKAYLVGVYDMNGRKVVEFNTMPGKVEIPYESGVYIIRYGSTAVKVVVF